MVSMPTTGQLNYNATVKAYIDGTAPAVAVANQAGVDITGATDSTTGITNAATTAGAGRALYFGPGTYKTIAGLNMALKQTWILDAGAVIQLDSAGSGHAVTVSASGCTITGGKVDASTTLFSGIFIGAGLTDVDVVDVEVSAGTYGVRCKGSTGAVTSRLRVLGCTIHGQSSHGVFFNWETQDSEIADCNIYSVGGNGIWVGNTSLRARIVNNSIVTSGRNGIEVFGGSAGSTVLGNNLSGIATIGITIDTSDGTRVADNRVDTVTTSYGLELAASNKCVVEGNTFKSVGSFGLSISALSGTCNDNTVANNIFETCPSGGISAGGSANGAQRLRILGNEIIDSAASTSAISNTPGLGCTDWIIANNTIRWSAALSTLAATTGINVQMPNALVANNEITADATITTSGGTGINLAATALNCAVVGNNIVANSKLATGIAVNSSVTASSLVANTIIGTTSALVNCAAASTTNIITGNGGTVSAGVEWTMGGAIGSNRTTSRAYAQHFGGQRFDGNIGFYATIPIAQQTRAGQLTVAAGTPSTTTTVDVGAAFSQSVINNQIATLATKLNLVETILHNLGLST